MAVKKIAKTFLEKQKKRLLKEKDSIMEHIIDLKADDPFSDPEYVNDNAAVDTEVREQNLHQVIEAEILSLQKRATDIDSTLEKIQKNRYGYCAKCNIPIKRARLELIHEAQYCVDCEMQLKK